MSTSQVKINVILEGSRSLSKVMSCSDASSEVPSLITSCSSYCCYCCCCVNLVAPERRRMNITETFRCTVIFIGWNVISCPCSCGGWPVRGESTTHRRDSRASADQRVATEIDCRTRRVARACEAANSSGQTYIDYTLQCLSVQCVRHSDPRHTANNALINEAL